MTDYVPLPPQSAASAPTAGSLDLPAYGVGPVLAVKRFFQNYAKFTGRASRSEYWWVALAAFVVYTILFIVGIVLGAAGASIDSTGTSQPGPLFGVFIVLLAIVALACIVPNIAVSVRRLHDANFSGFLYFLVFIPSFGSLIVLILNVLPSNPEGARFDVKS
jgi:uncharacterized membrane protein YhaH (DUF805 family)